MNETKHTPGPWQVGMPMQSEGKLMTMNPSHITAKDGDWICQVFEVPMHTTLEELLRSGNTSDAVGLANAQLIAAAPELLQALHDLTKEIHLSKLNIRKDFSLINAHACALKAITKAEGR